MRMNLCDYSDAYILVKGTILVPNTTAQGAVVNYIDKEVILKNWAPLTNCMTKINNTQAENAEHIDVIMPMYNLTVCSDAYSKTGGLWQYYRDEPALDHNGNIDFPDDNNNNGSFKFKQQITAKTGNGGLKNVEIMVPLKYLSNFWRTLEIPSIN